MSLRKFAVAWNLMWGLSYVIVALFAPWIGGEEVTINIVLYMALGISILLSLALLNRKKGHSVGRGMLAILGVVSVYGGIASWTGLTLWNVPFPNRELFQVSMAFADLLGAVFMFFLAIDS